MLIISKQKQLRKSNFFLIYC